MEELMNNRNQALLTMALSLGLISAGVYAEKSSTFSAEMYAPTVASTAGLGQAYYEVRGASELPDAPAPIAAEVIEDMPCPVGQMVKNVPSPVIDRPVPTKTKPVYKSNTCQPKTQTQTYYYRNGCYYTYPSNNCYQYQNTCSGRYYTTYNGYRTTSYYRGQPVRNAVRFFHNRQPIRNLFRGIFGRRCR